MYVMLKVLFYFALEVWFSIYIYIYTASSIYVYDYSDNYVLRNASHNYACAHTDLQFMVMAETFTFGIFRGRNVRAETSEAEIVFSPYRRYFRVRCTINRSHSTPCKKAEFEHLQIFPGHCLDLFLSVSGKICHSPIKKVKRQPTLIISFSQHSPFFGEQSKNPGWNPTRVRRYLGSAPGSLWQNSPHKMRFSASAWQI